MQPWCPIVSVNKFPGRVWARILIKTVRVAMNDSRLPARPYKNLRYTRETHDVKKYSTLGNSTDWKSPGWEIRERIYDI